MPERVGSVVSRRSIFQLPIQRMALIVPEPSRHTHHRTVRLIPWLQLHTAPAHDQHLLPPHQRVWRGRSAGRATRSAPPTSTPGAAMSYRSRRSPPHSSRRRAARKSTTRPSSLSGSGSSRSLCTASELKESANEAAFAGQDGHGQRDPTSDLRDPTVDFAPTAAAAACCGGRSWMS